MANQIIIDIGAVANDGTGDPLRTAFGYVNNNFSNVWASGVTTSNIAFDGNRILTTNTNGNLVLAPNGIGKVQSNVDIVPNANNTLSLGSPTLRWNTVYARNLEVAGDTTFNDLTVSGNLTVDGDIIQIGNLVTDAKTIQLANTASTANAANGSGITVGANDDIATMLYSSTSNTWTMNIGANVAGNVTAPYFIGNGSLLTGLANTYGNANVAEYLPTYGGNISAAYIDVANVVNVQNDVFAKRGTFTGDPVTGDASLYIGSPSFTNLGTDVMAQFTGNVTNYAQINLQNYGNSNTASGDYIITADNGTDSTHFLNLGLTGSNWDGSQPNSLGNALGANDGYLYVQDGNFVVGTSNGNIETWKFDQTGNLTVPGDILPVANNTQSLGNATNQWLDLWVSNATIYMNSVPITLGAGNVLTVNGEALLSNDSNTSITTTGNITADYFIGDGSLLTNLPFDASQIENGTSNVAIATANGNVTVTANSTQTWTFGTSGNLRFPDGTTYTGSEIDSPTVPTIGSTASAGEAGITYLTDPFTKWAIFSESAFTVGVWTDVQVGWTVTDNNGFTDIIAGRGSFGAASFETTVNNWPAPASGKTYVFTSPDYQLGYTNPVEITVGSDTWTFGNTGNFTLPNGGAIILENGDGVIGKDGDDLVISWDDEELILRSVNGDVQLEADGDIEIRSGYNFGTGDYGSRWIFNNNGELQSIPQDTANSSDYNGGYIQFVGNSSGDGNGYTTIVLRPDETAGGDQNIVIDPTAPNHIHIRAGGPQDDSLAQLYLGGELSHFSVGAGANPPLYIKANDNQWTYGTDGGLTVPSISTGGEGEQERAEIRGTRKIIGETGTWSTYIPGHSTFGNVAWTASSSTIQSAKITFVVQSNGTAFNWEQFDVSVCQLDSANAFVSVSGRIRQNSAIAYTEVFGYVSDGTLEVWLNPADGQTAAYINYDAVEFNIMPD